MPRKRRNPRRRRYRDAAPLLLALEDGAPWEWYHPELYVLETGRTLIPAFAAGGLEEVRAAWEEVRRAFLSEHIRRSPGTRPAAWWAFDVDMPELGELIVEPFACFHRDGLKAQSAGVKLLRRHRHLSAGELATLKDPAGILVVDGEEITCTELVRHYYLGREAYWDPSKRGDAGESLRVYHTTPLELLDAVELFQPNLRPRSRPSSRSRTRRATRA